MKEDIVASSAADWEEWVGEYSAPLLNRAYYLLSDREEAKDLVQEVFLAAYAQRDRFKGTGSPLSWLTGILYHKVADCYRERYKMPLESESPLRDFDVNGEWGHPQQEGGWPAEEEPVENLFDNLDFREVFYSCLEHLPAQWKVAVKLSYLERVKSADVCRQLGLTDAHFWKILQRSRLQLRGCLEKHWFDHEK